MSLEHAHGVHLSEGGGAGRRERVQESRGREGGRDVCLKVKSELSGWSSHRGEVAQLLIDEEAATRGVSKDSDGSRDGLTNFCEFAVLRSQDDSRMSGQGTRAQDDQEHQSWDNPQRIARALRSEQGEEGEGEKERESREGNQSHGISRDEHEGGG
jgi:hypothetical protein